MKRVISGVSYNTETASVVARYEYAEARGFETIEHLVTIYQTRGGALFSVDAWGEIEEDRYGDRQLARKVQFDTLDRDELLELVERWDGLEILDNSVLADPPEAAAEARAEAASLLLRLPQTLKQRVEAAAKSANQSTNSFLMRSAELSLLRDAGLRHLDAARRRLGALRAGAEGLTREEVLEAAARALDQVEDAAKAFGGVPEGASAAEGGARLDAERAGKTP